MPGMDMDAAAAYRALQARDARFDGRLFVGVTSTGVYCRPVCRVRTPRFENCRFFATCERAEAAAFRPCMKCRPEIAPGLSLMDSSRSLAEHAARCIDHALHSGTPLPLPALAARLGVTDRHLRRIFHTAHGVSPRDYQATRRLLLAKQLLTDTAQPVTQVALASGFDSLRRFNAAFVQHYRLNPSAFRRLRADAANPPPAQLRLAWRPPLDLEGLLGHHQRRELQGIEEVQGLTLRRTLAWEHRGQRVKGWLNAQFVPERCEVWVSTSDSLAPALGGLLQRVRQAFDLDADPAQVDPVMARLPLPLRPGLRLPGAFCGFEAAVRIVLGQQVTVKGARTLTQRLVNLLGEPISTPFPALTHLFPTPAAVAGASADSLGRLGIVRQRVRALQALAQAVASGALPLHRGAPLQATLEALRALPGIGDWTAQLVALRVLGWPDAWPASDIGLMNALGTRDPREVEALAEPWRPWRAYALMRLWHEMETRSR